MDEDSYSCIIIGSDATYMEKAVECQLYAAIMAREQMEMKHYKKQSQVVYNKKNGVEKPWLIRYNFHI